MGKLAWAAMMLFAASAWSDETLTAHELNWLRAGWPVLTYAEQQGMAIDIIVKPAAKPGDAPFAMGFADGRCKLVLSMRGNAEADAVLAGLPSDLTSIAIEAITAHEVAHCWRYTSGAWHELPAGFVQTTEHVSDTPEIANIRRKMRDTRREEGFADLVGLAWVAQHHAEHYTALHAWLAQLRDHQPVAGSFHDTRLWIHLADKPAVFGESSSPFEQAQILWAQGLRNAEH